MAIDRAEVRRIAELARLELTTEAEERMAAELSAVLEFVDALNQLDLTGCEPTVFAPADASLREDEPNGRRLGSDVATAGAPEAESGFFLVPPIVENVNP
jgi:aspartyl-tRNA(Asn)/glutamyl-tRNA(Gln) amidotransferase subunit C